MREILARSVWPGLLVWVGLYSCDYLLTQVTARLYQSRAKQRSFSKEASSSILSSSAMSTP